MRRRLGAWYTPPELVRTVVEAVVTAEFVAPRRAPMTVLDPACGDGRFLRAVAERIAALGGTCRLVGIDVDPAAVDAARAALPEAAIVHADALDHPHDGPVDLVIGNPPFRSPLAADRIRSSAASRASGPYADTAVEFLALAAELVDPHGGRVALVLPQSVLASRDAAAVRASIDARAHLVWSHWTGEHEFDALVHTCVLAFEFTPDPVAPRSSGSSPRSASWASIVTERSGVPALPADPAVDGVLGDRVVLNANFRDQYYGMIPAVGDHPTGPPLIATGLIDPGRCWWGERPVRFAGTRFARPRIDLDRLDDDMARWAHRRLVPKVLVATQTRVVEAVCDEAGEWLPAVPVVAAYPRDVHWDTPVRAVTDAGAIAWEVAAVLTSPFASAWLWHRSAGTGMAATAVRVSATVLADLPWPADAGTIADAVTALRAGDVEHCGALVDRAYGIPDDTVHASVLHRWWTASLPKPR